MTEGQEEIYAQVIQESEKKLLVLKMLANFFNHKDLFAVFIRTKIIHNLFEKNKNLDVNKLELFHVQYTSSLIELFQKLKKAKEQQYLLISDEIYINDDLCRKLETETVAANFIDESRKHARTMSAKLQELYNMLAAGAVVPFSWGDIVLFSGKRSAEYYREISGEDFTRITNSDGKNTYSNEFATIERKLLGRLNILNFRIKFACGLMHENNVVEVYDFIDSNDKFIFINATKSFYFLQEEDSKTIDLSKNLSNKSRIIMDLRAKSDQLKEKLGTVKTAVAKDVEEVLASYLEKISGVDFLDELQNVDEQTNILRAMLNININSK